MRTFAGTVVNLLIAYGAKTFGSDTLWIDIGSDLARANILLDLEAMTGIQLADEDIEHVQTVADLIVLVDKGMVA